MAALAWSSAGTARPPRVEALRRAAGGLLLPLAVAVTAAFVYLMVRGGHVGIDTRFVYWTAGWRVLHGLSPYVWSGQQLPLALPFVYPALSAILSVPVALVSASAAGIAGAVLCLALAPATLWLLGVRDARVFGVTLLWTPVFGAWQTANETMVLVFGIACVWRWRAQPLIFSALIAVLISLKPMMWPLVLWPVAVRHWRRLAYVVALGLMLNLVAWAVIGFGQIASLLHAASAVTDAAWRTGYGAMAIASHLGLDRTAGLAVTAAGVIWVAHRLWRLRFREHGEVEVLLLLLAMMLISSPLVWGHYLSVLLVPMAILLPRLNWLWFVPVLMWVCPPSMAVHGWQAVVVWLAAGSMFAALTRRARRPGCVATAGASG